MSARKVRISVVDDETTVRKALGRLLSASNFDAQTFPSGRAFLDSLSSQRPDCLVLDLHMPDLSGLDVLQKLSSEGLTLPTIVITAYDEPDAQVKCIAIGASAYLRKPLDDETLLAAVASALELARSPLKQMGPRTTSTPAKFQP